MLASVGALAALTLADADHAGARARAHVRARRRHGDHVRDLPGADPGLRAALGADGRRGAERRGDQPRARDRPGAGGPDHRRPQRRRAVRRRGRPARGDRGTGARCASGLRDRPARPPSGSRPPCAPASASCASPRPCARVLLRGAAFSVSASALWALLPVVALGRLGLSDSSFGLLMGCVGTGAILGATMLPRLRRRLAFDRMIAFASVGLACGLLALAYVPWAELVAFTLLLTGACWLIVLSSLNTSAQRVAPGLGPRADARRISARHAGRAGCRQPRLGARDGRRRRRNGAHARGGRPGRRGGACAALAARAVREQRPDARRASGRTRTSTSSRVPTTGRC